MKIKELIECIKIEIEDTFVSFESETRAYIFHKQPELIKEAAETISDNFDVQINNNIITIQKK